MRLPGWARPWRVIGFLVFYLGQLIVANAYVAWEVVSPGRTMRPGVIGVEMVARTPLEITLLANLITLTPGTISLDVDEERWVLYVHGLHVRDPESFRQRIGALEDRLLRVLR